MTMIERRVQRGARLLDREMPGWTARIDGARLDVGTGTGCPLGQLYGCYWEGVEALGLRLPARYGFVRPILTRLSNTEAYRRLTMAWRAEIARRRYADRIAPFFGPKAIAPEIAEAAA